MYEAPRGRPRTSGRAERFAASRAHRRPRTALAAVLIAVAASTTTGCVYYEPVPAYRPGPSKFDRSWDAARAAAEDVGVTITDVDRARGTMHGYKGSSDVTITAWQQADGSVRVGFNVRAPSGPDAELADHLSRAFDRRMSY